MGISSSEWDGDTPLHSAVIACDAGVMKVLLETGAGLDATDGNGGIPLHAAAGSGCPETVRILLEAATGERIAALEAIGAGKAESIGAEKPNEAARTMERQTPAMEKTRSDRGLEL